MEVTGSCRLVSRQCNVPVSARESNGIQQQQQQKQQVCNLGGSAFMGERVVHGFLKTGQCTSLKGKAQSRIRPKKQSLVVSSVLADFPMETVVAPREQKVKKLANPNTVFSIILGGGAGKRLNPLTLQRATPAVPIGGSYRLIDVPMSNCINSGINKIYILTQYNSTSLNRHLAHTYNYGNGVNFGNGYVEVLAATQRPGVGGQDCWFQGTADAVRQYMWLFEDVKNKDVEDVIILSGDHLYRMDYLKFVQRHKDTDADVTVACVPMDYSHAAEYPLMKINNEGQVIQFNEKPRRESLTSMQVDATVLGLSPNEARRKPFIASMGIYVFKKRVLLKLLRWRYPSANDFAAEILPASVNEFNVQAYLFRDYWEDIGTIKSFFDANLALTAQPPKFSFYDAAKPTFTSPRYLPPTKIERCRVKDSIISHGCFLRECSVEHSVVGVRSRLEGGVQLKDTVMMGADTYETEVEMSTMLGEGKVPLGVGENTRISNCIVDKNARIGHNVVIANTDGVLEAARPKEGFYIRSGITIILKNSTIVPGTVI
ncbi:unnamed protein product [Sphagnum jensenii]|uniref:Glucose-1-phosphate adenylyltransferase n=1 Tax=Sphagnum jensenii TaxID=128206 RepID=A0ABP1B6W1_9BRYO